MHAEGLLLALVGVDKLQVAFMSSFETFAPFRCRADEFREAYFAANVISTGVREACSARSSSIPECSLQMRAIRERVVRPMKKEAGFNKRRTRTRKGTIHCAGGWIGSARVATLYGYGSLDLSAMPKGTNRDQTSLRITPIPRWPHEQEQTKIFACREQRC